MAELDSLRFPYHDLIPNKLLPVSPIRDFLIDHTTFIRSAAAPWSRDEKDNTPDFSGVLVVVFKSQAVDYL